MRFPGTKVIVVSAILLGLVQYLVRIWLPVGWSLPYTGLQVPFFGQYIFMLIFGVVAYENKWLDEISFKIGKQWFIFTQIMILIVLPTMLYIGGKEDAITPFLGGGTWQSCTWAIWEQLTGFAMIIGLFGLSKKHWNTQGSFAKQLSDSSYGVYIIHTPVIVGISAVFLSWDINQLLKFIILAPLAVITSFIFAWIIRQIPGVKRVV